MKANKNKNTDRTNDIVSGTVFNFIKIIDKTNAEKPKILRQGRDLDAKNK